MFSHQKQEEEEEEMIDIKAFLGNRQPHQCHKNPGKHEQLRKLKISTMIYRHKFKGDFQRRHGVKSRH